MISKQTTQHRMLVGWDGVGWDGRGLKPINFGQQSITVGRKQKMQEIPH